MIRILGWAGLFASLAFSAMAEDARVTGTATFRERMALPPGAVFEAVLQDVSRADALALPLGEFRKTDPGAPPFRFEIAYDASEIRAEGSYAVRAMVWVNGKLRFTTDTFEPVLTKGGSNDVNLLMVGVGRDGETAGPLRPRARAGRGGDGAPMRGYVSFADGAPSFTDCASGEQLAVADDGDYSALEHAYLAAGAESGGRLMASFVGSIVPAKGTAGEFVMVERFLGVWPEEGCDMAATGTETLDGTSWRILQIGPADLSAAAEDRPPTFRFLADDRLRFAATVGCNQLIGAVELNGTALKFGPPASTMMACTPPLDAWEKKLGNALERTVSWRGDGEVLELLDETGAIAMKLAAAAPADANGPTD